MYEGLSDESLVAQHAMLSFVHGTSLENARSIQQIGLDREMPPEHILLVRIHRVLSSPICLALQVTQD